VRNGEPRRAASCLCPRAPYVILEHWSSAATLQQLRPGPRQSRPRSAKLFYSREPSPTDFQAQALPRNPRGPGRTANTVYRFPRIAPLPIRCDYPQPNRERSPETPGGDFASVLGSITPASVRGQGMHMTKKRNCPQCRNIETSRSHRRRRVERYLLTVLGGSLWEMQRRNRADPKGRFYAARWNQNL